MKKLQQEQQTPTKEIQPPQLRPAHAVPGVEFNTVDWEKAIITEEIIRMKPLNTTLCQ